MSINPAAIRGYVNKVFSVFSGMVVNATLQQSTSSQFDWSARSVVSIGSTTTTIELLELGQKTSQEGVVTTEFVARSDQLLPSKYSTFTIGAKRHRIESIEIYSGFFILTTKEEANV